MMEDFKNFLFFTGKILFHAVLYMTSRKACSVQPRGVMVAQLVLVQLV